MPLIVSRMSWLAGHSRRSPRVASADRAWDACSATIHHTTSYRSLVRWTYSIARLVLPTPLRPCSTSGCHGSSPDCGDIASSRSSRPVKLGLRGGTEPICTSPVPVPDSSKLSGNSRGASGRGGPGLPARSSSESAQSRWNRTTSASGSGWCTAIEASCRTTDSTLLQRGTKEPLSRALTVSWLTVSGRSSRSLMSALIRR